jgi:lipid-A-disaccharide synthase
MVVKVPYIGLVNLVAENKVVPEFVQKEVTPAKLANEMLSILKSPQRKIEMARDLKMVKKKLGEPGASERTARIALDMIYHGV